MAAAELQRHLAELHEVIDSGGTAHGPETAQDLVVDIAQLCLNQTRENELAFCRSELFQKETGIITFLQKAVTKDEYAGSKVQALEFLLSFVQKAKELVLEHAKDIKDVSMSLYTRDKLAKVKAKTFPLVIELLKLTSGTRMDEAMGVDAMLTKFFGELGQPSKLSQSVKLGIYQTLGAFGEYYPQLMMHYSDRLFNVLVSTLKQQMTTKTKKPEMTTVAGCLMGLSHLLVNFTQSVEENSKHCKDIYQYVTMSVDPGPYRSGTKHRYDIPKAGLNLIGKHAAQFNEYLYRDHEMVYNRLKYWSHSHNSEMKWAGYEALQEFFKVVSHMLVENADKKRSSDVAVLKYFIKSFRSTIDDASSSSKSLSTAIRGYGVFAAPCKAFMKEADVRFMFNEIIQRSERQFLVQGEERLSQLPTYLEALASIVGQLDTVSDTILTSLEKLVVLVFGSYPQQARSGQWTSHSAILQILIALSAKGTSLQGFLSRVVYQWILRTCSFPVLLESGGDVGEEQRGDEMEIEQDSRRVSYKSFMDLWTRLLDSKFIKTSEAHGSSYAERLNIHTMIYNELIGGILKVLKKLDLSSNKHNDEEASTSGGVTSDLEGSTSSDPLEGLQPTKPKDFQVFINLVDFTKELLPTRQIHLFDPWVYRFGHELIQLSSQLPLVSGFYKLLTICMTMSRKTAYFKEVNPNVTFKTEVKEELMDVDDDSESIATRTTPSNMSLSDKQACFILFSKFSKEVLIRLKQYKDDLLASCLFLILSLPHQVVENQVHDVIPALKTAFKLGLSYLPLAESGLSALQAWIRYIPSDVLKPYYAQVLPQLDGYLGAGSGSEDEGSRPEVLVIQTASSRVGRRRIPSKLLKKAKDNNQSQDSPLRSVQLQILRLLGSLGGSVNVGLLETSAQELSNVALAWDSQPRLNFPVPFVDMKPEIQLDAFLPRIVELALTSSDRQTKVAACEALHTLVLFMLGKGSQQPDQREAKSPMNQLYKKVFPAVLQLACDVEQVARQLFEPLVMQLIHWFSGNKKYESDETSTLLNAILAGIVHPTDTALRDFCARCISEFLRWSIKQTSKKQQEKSPINTKSLLKRLYSMASHPSAFKRLGAALAFNSIYTIFREEEVLVDQFTFELLVVFVESLALAHHDDKSLGTQEQGSEVLKHLERIMRVKAVLLNKESKNRRVPRGLPEDCSPTLSHMVMWLMTQCGRPQTECRHQCMVLVYGLTSLLPGRNTPVTWMQNTARERGAEYFVGRFEGGGHKSGIQKQPTLASVEQQFSVKATITWLEYLLAALDCYVWVLGENLLTPAAVFKTVKEGKKSVLFQTIDSFMKVAQYDLFTFAKGCGSTETAFTPREEEDYNRTKCTVIIRLFYFMGAMLGSHTKEALEVIPSKLWTGLFAEILCGCVLKPDSLGFNMADTVIMNALPQTTNRILDLLYTKLPTEQLKELETVIHKRITASRSEDLFSILPMLFNDESDLGLDHVQLQHLVNGYKQLQKAKLLTKQTTNQALSILDFVMRGLVRRGENGQEVRKMTPSEIDLGQRLLELSFQLGVQTNSLIDCLLKTTPVVSSTRTLTSRLSASKTSLGVLFLTTYKQPIMDQLVKHGQETVYELSDRVREDSGTIGTIIYGLLEHAVGNREIRKRYGMAIYSAVLTRWDTLSNLGQEDDFMLNLIKKVLQIDFKFATDTTHPAFRLVFNQYLSMLRDPKKSLAWKTQVLDVLYFFANVPEKEEKELKSALDLLVANHFPLKSTDLEQGSPRYNDYIMALNKILTSMVMSGSLMLLELNISILCRDDKHSYEDKIQGALSSFAKRLSLEKQSAAANIPFEIFKQDKRYSKEIRKAAIQRVCIPLLRQASRDAMMTFYKGHIHDIISVLEARLTKNPVPAFENQLVSKICYFELIEVLYSRLSKDDLNSKDSALNREYRHGNVEKGNEMSTALTKAALGARNEDCRGETVAVELRRQFHCAAFNCSAAIISCVQDNIKFYNAFLFSENHAKGQFLLDNLVDSKKEYSFAIEMDAPVERKKRFVAIRTQARETNTPEESGYVSGPAHYLSSQYLSDSSLSEDVNQFDFSSSVRHFGSSMESQRDTGSQGSQGSQRTGSMASRQDSKPVFSPGGEYLEMEEDALNQHECMAAMTGVLKHMTNNKINPDITKATKAEEMPQWMSGLQKKLSSSSTEHNIKLFIVRLLINAQDVFQPYARFWLSPLMQFLAGGQQGGINYMVLDIMLVMLDWSTVAVPEDKRLASGVLRFLMENSYHERKSVMKNNLEVIKTLVECWKEVVDVPTRVIYESLQDQSPDKKDSAVGIHLLGVILANNLHPLSPTCDVDADRFYSALASNIDNRYKAVHGAAAEVIGMAMKQMAEVDKITDGHLHEVTYKELSQLHLGSGKEVIFITCLHKIHLHYPVFTDRFMNKLLFMLPSIHGQPKTECLQIITARIEHIDNAFIEMKNKNILALLTHKDEADQLTSLKLVDGMLPKLKPSELRYLLPAVKDFVSHPSPSCRDTMYSILMWIYDNYRDEDRREGQDGDEALSIAKDTLLQGLSDQDNYLRLRVSNFWSHETRLPKETLERLISMLGCMYSPATENRYLGYATNLLLEMTSKSPDFKREIFEHPLSACKFEEVQIDHSWRQRHAAISTPKFVETQVGQSQGSIRGSPSSQSMTSSGMSMAGGGGGQLRVTQATQNFTATQDNAASSHKNGYNWLTGSQDTFADYSSSSSASESSLLFTMGSLPKRTALGSRGIKQEAGAGGSRDKEARKAPSEGEKEVQRLKRRFMKDQSSQSAFFAKRATRQKQLREEVQKSQRERRFAQVTMYRQYRTGDLPDIQIKHSDIIAPLQALALRDSTLSRLLFCALFRGILARIGDMCTDEETELHVNGIERHLNQMLTDSNQFDPAFISCMLEIGFYHSEQLTLDPAAISQSCLTSRQLLIGIRVLEEVLIKKSGDDERSRKRARTSRPESSQEMSTWIELARLYKAMGEFDVLRGIFGALIKTKDVTQEAIQAESRGDYESALELYSKAISSDWGQDGVAREEEDFWDEARLQCCNQLTKWDDMENFSTDQIEGKGSNDLTQIWNDDYQQEIYLPYMMRSKLKRLMEGSGDDSLLSFIDSSAKDQEKRVILESRYTEELAALSILKEDYNRAKYYLSNCTSSFLQEWSGLGPLMLTSRLSKLQDIQKLTEAEQFLQLANKPFSEGLKSSATRLLSDWSRNLPDPKRDPISVWDDVTQYRCLYMDKLCNLLGDSGGGGGDTMETEDQKFDDLVRREKVLLSMKMADSACQQANFCVAAKHLKSTLRGLAEFEDLRPAWTHSYVSMTQRKALLLKPYERITSLLKALDFLGKLPVSHNLGSDLFLLCDHHILTSKTYQSMASALQEEKGEMLTRLGDAGKLDKLLSAAECQENKPEKVCQSLFMKSKKYLDDAVGTIKLDPDTHSSSSSSAKREEQSMGKAHMALVSFCDQLLRQQDDDDCNPDCLPFMGAYPSTVVNSTLQAMNLNSAEARKHFPRLLQLVEKYPDTMKTLVKKASIIPSWMFIGWISQMVALLDKPESLAVQDILKAIAKDYPQALVYPFKISSEDFKLGGKSLEEKQRKDAVKKIEDILSTVPLVENLTLALQRLTHPGFIFKDWVGGINSKMNSKTRNHPAIKQEYQQLYQQLFESGGRRGEPSSSSQTVEAGPYWKKFGREWQKRFDSSFGQDGSKLAAMDYKAWAKLRQDICAKMTPGKDDPGNLKEYSPWFTAFQTLQGDELEIPGQYDGSKKPLPAYHVKIAGFEETVLTLSSLRKPKCITIRGNDEMDYPFLVKVGEDLRMDQRIEQLFCIMNGILAQDAACSQRGLTLTTYQVVPMTPRLGILEWVKRTTTLKDFITRSMTEAEHKVYTSRTNGPGALFTTWLQKFYKTDGNITKLFTEAYKNANETETIKAFREREAKLPWDLLRRGFMQLSASPEAFLTLRAHFARSHAVLCICQYILGIGDRHLSNFLVSLETGGMVGIDFGHSFGSATQFLPIPELIPFRLTRQIINLMLPMKIDGVLQSTMVHTLRALRQNHELLVNTMDVFVKEPSLDWKGFAVRQADYQKLSEDSREDISWYPKKKIKFAKMKLQGVNSTYITKEELEMGHSKDAQFLRALKSTCGGNTESKRAQCQSTGLSVEDQVACLIDQATDPRILGKTYQGWEPWV